ncbi:MAG: lipoate--protein ligase family protein [Bacteroidetes bacterium]|nr:lipoate--protein ligase family protein [Bacteroidota bacterium]
MIFFQNFHTDPFFNIAAEEFLLKYIDEDVLMLYSSDDSVIVGKHQISTFEANQQFVSLNKIPVIRRISGGGTVFHDSGNINFMIITKSQNPDIDFSKHTKPVIDFLNKAGYNASFKGKNDIRIDDWKVSGNAAHLFKNKTLYHGTLLFDSNLEKLNNSIKPSGAVFETKAVQSNRSNVRNISDFKSGVSKHLFFENLKDYLCKYYAVKTEIGFSQNDILIINKLINDKYKTDEWNYHYSPDYVFRNYYLFNDLKLEFRLRVKRGLIEEVDYNTALTDLKTDELFKSLLGVFHTPENVIKVLFEKDLVINVDTSDFRNWELLRSFF